MIAMSKPKIKWEKNEIAQLKLVNPKLTTWKQAQLAFPRHSAEECRQKWHSEFTSNKKGPWTLEEDEKLRHAMRLAIKWTTVAAIVETRSYAIPSVDNRTTHLSL
ncbi:hypothetical protein SDRG_17412, partial [Saprolegnia diclina VS20]